MIFQLGPAMLDAFVLSIVSREDTYGYQLSQEIKTVVCLKESTLYPVLRRLLEAGYLEAYDKPYQGRNRKYYRLTAAGRNQLYYCQDEWEIFKRNADRIIMGGNTDE